MLEKNHAGGDRRILSQSFQNRRSLVGGGIVHDDHLLGEFPSEHPANQSLDGRFLIENRDDYAQFLELVHQKKSLLYASQEPIPPGTLQELFVSGKFRSDLRMSLRKVAKILRVREGPS